MLDELVDRYGTPPEAVKHLVAVSRLRRVAQLAGLSDVVAMGPKLRIAPANLPDSRRVRLERLYPGAKHFAQNDVILVPFPTPGGELPDDADLIEWVVEARHGDLPGAGCRSAGARGIRHRLTCRDSPSGPPRARWQRQCAKAPPDARRGALPTVLARAQRHEDRRQHDRHARAEQHGERALVGDLGEADERELVHEQRHREADAAERADDDRSPRVSGVPDLAAARPARRAAGDRDADDLADRQADEDAPERRVELARRHLRHRHHRRGEREQRQDDAVRPRLERVHGPAARAPRHHEAEGDAGDRRVHARAVDEVPGEHGEHDQHAA